MKIRRLLFQKLFCIIAKQYCAQLSVSQGKRVQKALFLAFKEPVKNAAYFFESRFRAISVSKSDICLNRYVNRNRSSHSTVPYIFSPQD
nr:MAG TPA: hypothetical protein [Caudoviricetes sp.]